MKKLLLSILSIATITGSINAQNDQTTNVGDLGEGKFTKYVIAQEGSDYNITGCCADIWIFTSKPYHEKFIEINVKEFDTDKNGTDYFPDEEAFPVTYVKGRYEGNAEMIKEFNVVELTSSDRLVFTEEWIYQLQKWKSKDDYVIKNLIKREELSGFKGVKASFSAAKKNEGNLRRDELQAYLDAAFKKQADVLPAWKEANKDLIEEREINVLRVEAAIKGKNDAYWQSEEGQRKLARMRKDGGSENKVNKYTIQNNTGGLAHFISNGGIGDGGYFSLNSSGTNTVSCEDDTYHAVQDGSGTWRKGALIVTGESSCGKIITVD